LVRALMDAFHAKCASGDLSGVQAALAGDPALSGSLDSNQWSGVHHATKHGHTDVLEALLGAGAAVDARTHHDSTALHIAACQDRAAAAKVLLAHHSDVEARDNKKNTAVLRAAQHGTAGVLVLLLEAKQHVGSASGALVGAAAPTQPPQRTQPLGPPMAPRDAAVELAATVACLSTLLKVER